MKRWISICEAPLPFGKQPSTFAESRGISKEFSTMIKNIIGWDIPHEDI